MNKEDALPIGMVEPAPITTQKTVTPYISQEHFDQAFPATPSPAPCYATACHTLVQAEMAIVNLENELDRITAERDALKLDAQRYRWLRHGDNDEKVLCNGPVDKDYWYLLRNKKLDDATDEAIAKEKS